MDWRAVQEHTNRALKLSYPPLITMSSNELSRSVAVRSHVDGDET